MTLRRVGGLLACAASLVFTARHTSVKAQGQSPNVVRASVANDGTQADHESFGSPSLSADGRYVAFTSIAQNLVDEPVVGNNSYNVYVRDLLTGHTERISGRQDGAGDYLGWQPSISADGRYVAFMAAAFFGNAVFVRDRLTAQTIQVTPATFTNQGRPAISGNGQYVAFESYDLSMVPGDTNGRSDIFVADLAGNVRRVSLSSTGAQREFDSNGPAISADGRFIAYSAREVYGVVARPDGFGFVLTGRFVFVNDLWSGAVERYGWPLPFIPDSDIGRYGPPDTFSELTGPPGLTPDGRFITFRVANQDTVSGFVNYFHEVRVVDRQTAFDDVVASGDVSRGGAFAPDQLPPPSISADGRFVAFTSSASTLVAEDTNGVPDVFVFDRQLRVTTRVSRANDGAQANGQSGSSILGALTGSSSGPAISADGRSVAFLSLATNLVADDTNGVPDFFVGGVGAVDSTPPSVSCGSADGLWHTGDVSISCAASDAQSGLANPADTSFSLTTNVASGVESANAPTGTRTICDAAGNCTTVGPVSGNRVDKKTPTISITQPATATYFAGQKVVAAYACTDGGAGVTSCAGSVPDGTPIDTATVGSRNFTVNTQDQVGNAATQSVSYTVVRAATMTALTSAPTPSGLSQAVTLRATVSVVAPGAGVPSGVIQFFDGTTLLGSASLAAPGGSGTLIANGLASGQHSLTASYGGDASYIGSTSSAMTHTVNGVLASSLTTLSSTPAPSAVGSKVTLTATVTVVPRSGPPSGIVRFLDGTTVLGTSTLSAAASGGKAALSTTTLAVGTHVLTATYVGDQRFAGSSSLPLAQTVYAGAKPSRTMTTVTSLPNPSVLGRSVTLKAVMRIAGTGTATGGIQFTADGLVIGVVTLIKTPTGGTATLNTGALSRGAHVIAAQYLGDPNFAGSASNPVLQLVR